MLFCFVNQTFLTQITGQKRNFTKKGIFSCLALEKRYFSNQALQKPKIQKFKWIRENLGLV